MRAEVKGKQGRKEEEEEGERASEENFHPRPLFVPQLVVSIFGRFSLDAGKSRDFSILDYLFRQGGDKEGAICRRQRGGTVQIYAASDEIQRASPS